VVEQQLSRAALEPPEVERLADELHEARPQRLDAVDRDEQVPPGDAGDEPGDRRVRLAVEADDQVLDPADPFPRPVDERAPDERGQVEGIRGHQGPQRKTSVAASPRSP